MQGSRTQKSVGNIAFSVLFQLVTLLTNFAMKSVFIKYLGIQYTGVSALFTDLLAILSMGELGFSTAISYALYRPLYEKNEAQILKLMHLYKRIYRVVFAVVLTAGLICLVFLRFFIKDVPDIQESIHLIFIFFVLKTAISYLFVYKATLLEANQEKNVLSIVGIAVRILGTGVEIAVIVITGNYLYYLAVSLVTVILQNTVISYVADKKHPVLKKPCPEELSREEKGEIFKNVRALAIYKVCATLQRNVDSIIISIMLGTAQVGFLSCYRMIAGNVDNLFGQIFEAIKSGVGNLAVSESTAHQHGVFRKMCFASFVIGNFITVSLLVLTNPFISLWLGEEYLLGMDVVLFLAADVYILAMERAYENFREAHALFVPGKYRPAIMIAVNVILSVWLAKDMGIAGVLLATVLARLVTHVWYDPWLLYRRIFHKPFAPYLREKLLYALAVAADCALVYSVCNLISVSEPGLAFVIKVLCCAVLPNVFVIVFFHGNQQFKVLYQDIKRLIHKG